MARESLDSKAKHVFVLIAPHQGTMMHVRKLTGEGTHNSRRIRGKPESMWLRLKREGDVLTGYKSVIGGKAEHPEWHEIYSSHLTMNSTLEIGMAVTSHQWQKYAEAEFDHFSIDQPTNTTGMGRRGLRGTGI
jgi:regulation of enolase protein 1 (concanavalin A-like superfamily)